MGRVTPSFRVKLAEAVSRVRGELVEFLAKDERRRAFRRVAKVWREESNALSSFSQPYIYGSLLLVSVIDLQAQVDELRRRVEELERLRGAKNEGASDRRRTKTRRRGALA